MTRKEKAMNYFLEGYNCSQSVVLAFADLLEMEPDQLARLSSAFGGGMGRLREVCGSVSGMFIVLGILFGYDDPKENEGKKELYEKVQELAHRFEAENGSIVCRDLLGLSVKSQEPVPEQRSAEYYKKRPCKELVGCATEILEEFLEEVKYPLQ
ncbi:MAG: C_GCAxxG_C_C family protein [Agathobacter sp.]|nr:C_GCAxxG_C_C family protein [Agathobacter sp.]